MDAIRKWQPQVVREDGSSTVVYLLDLFKTWGVRWGIDPNALLVWPTCPELAHAFPHGHLKHDVSVIWRRFNEGMDWWCAPPITDESFVSDRALAVFRTAGGRVAYPAALESEFRPDLGPVVKQHRGCVKAYPFRTMLASIRLARRLRQQDRLSQAGDDFNTLDNVLRFGSEVAPVSVSVLPLMEKVLSR